MRREPAEAFSDYRTRRAASNRAYAERLKPRMAHVSTEIVRLPVIGVDPAADRAVLEGKVRDVKLVALPGGKQFRAGRTKGVTYRK